MTTTATTTHTTNSRRPLGAAIAAAVAASICCVGPLVLIALGASGAWMSSLTLLEPIRPLLILTTGGFLGYAVARVYVKSSEPEVCEPGSLCADPRTDRINKAALWGVTVLVAGLLMVPTFVGMADRAENTAAAPPRVGTRAAVATEADDASTRKQVALAVENMTCAACPRNVRKVLAALDGVKVLDVTFDPPRAVVEYDPSKTSISDLTEATKNVGYPSAPAS